MILNIEGGINRYYAQTLCLMFFPGAKFPVGEEPSESIPVVNIKTQRTEEGYKAFASIEYNGKYTNAEAIERFKKDERYTDERTMKVAAGLAMYSCGSKHFGFAPPWGMLTGIRPAKLAKELYRMGKSKAEIKRALTKDYLVNPKKAALVSDIVINEAKTIGNIGKDSCSVYISIPFCPTRCAYCSFVSYSTNKLLELIPDYLERLCLDIKDTFKRIHEMGEKIVSIYIGGGTPTILDEFQLEKLLKTVSENLSGDDHVREFTLEAGRPDTITAGKLKVASEHGVTRISVNTQTLNDSVLDMIGRKHTAKDFYNAFSIARESDIKYINTDLIAGLPYESYSSFSKSVDEVLKLRPDNVTFHVFCAKKSADIIQSGLELYSVSGGDTGKSVDYSQLKAKNAGYIPYYIYRQKNTIGNLENVGFAQAGAECLYNILIMEEIHSIYAVGAGATTKIVSRDNGQITRLYMPKYPYEYLKIEDREGHIEANFDKIRKFIEENRINTSQ